MFFNEQIVVSEQLGNAINDVQSNTLTVVSTQDSGLVTLCVSGVAELCGHNSEGNIQTVMTGDECLKLVWVLLDACRVADSEAAA